MNLPMVSKTANYQVEPVRVWICRNLDCKITRNESKEDARGTRVTYAQANGSGFCFECRQESMFMLKGPEIHPALEGLWVECVVEICEAAEEKGDYGFKN
ncbi:hypothetical protein ABW19_dt0200827 [Dactylella cylindrospora]|nr:hypothetical protein ABW19_dt0200827 [Dactylella cylindrospora]